MYGVFCITYTFLCVIFKVFRLVGRCIDLSVSAKVRFSKNRLAIFEILEPLINSNFTVLSLINNYPNKANNSDVYLFEILIYF